MDISVLRFYEYIRNIGEISMDILIKIIYGQKLFKIHGNALKNTKKKKRKDKVSKNTHVKVIL